MGGLLCFTPDANTPGKRDATGAFWPGARAFALHALAAPARAVLRFPASAPLAQRRLFVSDSIRTFGERIDTLAFFCHGYRDGLQAGYTKPTVLGLARLVALYAAYDAHVLLYCCSTASDSDADTADERAPGPGGEGGFADSLRDACELLGRKVTIMGHTTTGHTFENPHARRFSSGTGGVGGQWYVEPDSPAWPRWTRALRMPENTLRWRFPYMTSEAIRAELLSPPRVA